MQGSLDTAPTSAEIMPPVEELQGLAWTPEEAKHRGIYGFDSRDARSRSFNLLRARIMRLHAERGWRTFGIVSASPGVGKSFIATNLAASLSRTPKLVTTLIDLDLRRGSVSRNFGYPLDRGIRAFLEGETDTLGELGLVYRLASVVFVGGSLTSLYVEPIRNPSAPSAGSRPPELAGCRAILDAVAIAFEQVAERRHAAGRAGEPIHRALAER